MEEALASQLVELRKEQEQLEEQLGHTALGVPCGKSCALNTTLGAETYVESQRCVRELTVHEANSAILAAASTCSGGGGEVRGVPQCKDETSMRRSSPHVPVTTGGTARMHWSYQERLSELESLKRKYETYAREAMSQYFSSVSGYQGYKERREKMMKRVKPFAFESRELVKPLRIREQRAEAETRAREAAVTEHLRHPYKATPVPPSTFMNKYALMVEEWCQRKAAIEIMSRERARIAKDEAAFVRLSAHSLRSTREELMGVVYGPDGKPVTRNELRRRAQSADATRSRCKGTGASLREVPLEVRMKLWPALSDHERLRRERIKYLATVRKSEVDAEVHQVMPLLTSPSPARCYSATSPGSVDMVALLAAVNRENMSAGAPCYGVGQAVLPSKPTPLPTAEAGALAAAPSLSTAPQPPTAANGLPLLTEVPPPAPPSASPQASTAAAMTAPAPVPSLPAAVPQAPPGVVVLAPSSVAPTAPAPSFPTGSASPAASAPAPAPTAAVVAPVSSATTGSAVVLKAAKQSTQEGKETSWRRYNPQLTFKPNVRPGVPNFEALWTHHTVELAQKKLQHPTTVPKPFDLTPSARDSKNAGPRPVRSASALGPRSRHGSPSGGKKRQGVDTPSTSAGNVTALPSSGSSAPRGTRAHALRTQAIYSNYVKQSEEKSMTAEGDEQYWKAVAQRQREVRKRLSAYLVDHHAEHERAIMEKVRALRTAMRENEKAAAERLAEMRRRVAEMPPVFAEPVHLNEQSKARVEAEKIVLQSLKEAGLDGPTIKRILTSPLATAEDSAADATAGAAPDATTEAATDALVAEATSTSRNDGDAASPVAAGEEDSGTKGTPSSSAAQKPPSDHLKAWKHDSSDSSASSDSDDSSTATSSTSSGSSIKKSPPSSSVTKRSSLPSASMLSVPVPKPVVERKQSITEYSDDSFESSDSD